VDLHTPSGASQIRPMIHETRGMRNQKCTLKLGQEKPHNETSVSHRRDWENYIKNKLGKSTHGVWVLRRPVIVSGHSVEECQFKRRQHEVLE